MLGLQQQKKLKVAVLIADSNFSSLSTDKNLLQVYGESLLQLTYHRIRELFDKVLVVVNNFDQQSIYARQLGDDVLVNMDKDKNEITAALTAFQACKKIPGAEWAFVIKANAPLIEKKTVNLVLKSAKPESNAVIPQHANGTVESFHALYKIAPMAKALEHASND